jgi:hypothetical protein
MAPPRIPGGGRGRGRGGYKGRMGKKFKKNPDGSDKPKRKKTGFGIWGVGAIFAAMLGLVGFAAKRENDVREAASTADRVLGARVVPHGLPFRVPGRGGGDAGRREGIQEALHAGRAAVSAVGAGERTRPRGLGGVPGRDEARDGHRHRHGPPLRAVLTARREDEREAAGRRNVVLYSRKNKKLHR